MEFSNPQWFWALLILPVLIGIYLYRFFAKKRATIAFSSLNLLDNLPGNWKAHLHWLTAALLWAGIALLIVALARPQERLTTVERNAEGIDIVLVMDMSTSMRAEDLKPNRFEAARQVAKDFVDMRESDRIGLVTFAMKSFTVVPPTLDYRLLKNLIDDLEMGVIEDGTAIGMGLATAVNRLKESPAESKVIILLTDGQNNAGEIDPVTAADLALTYDIKIYTIGAGTRGTAPYPVQDPIFGRRYQNIQVDIDEEMLTSVAELTGGKYFRATDTDELEGIYDEIDELERSEVEELIYTDYEDLYMKFLAGSFVLIFLSLAINKLYLRGPEEV
ncbi:vWA domain-containing protein [Gracilimonas mengyeensis]|uniref:Ca-activated chloride channel family protein n=1 Tax=Gracilimonas mengyeensis TaxID=1302730 RepID=A0A521FJA0_9BACT|nr:VWA domain-containing protein [Gracilimonas mengyeensis]SMO96283.1 Ca-activated chloride channel family protein [Gracilimonas mengyeensis]